VLHGSIASKVQIKFICLQWQTSVKYPTCTNMLSVSS
jgi:hypothetical protein